MQSDFMQGKAEQRGEPPGFAGTGWQALNGDVTHGFGAPWSEVLFSIA